LIRWDILKHHYEQLKISPLLESGGRIDLMIGLDLTHLLCPSDSREGEVDEPCTWKTRLGWFVRGPTGPTLQPRSVRMNFCQAHVDADLEA